MRGTLMFVNTDGMGGLRGHISGTGLNAPLTGNLSGIAAQEGATWDVEYSNMGQNFVISQVYGGTAGGGDPRGQGYTDPVILPPAVVPSGGFSMGGGASPPPLTAGDPSQGWWEAITGALGGFVTGGIPGAIGGGIGGFVNGGTVTCPTGSMNVGGKCVATTVGGWLPGGQPAVYTPPTPPTGTVGSMGPGAIPGMYSGPPSVRQVATRRCPRGSVLGLDGNCYPKAVLPRKWRMWVPGPKPLLSAQDGKILRRASSIEHKLDRVSSKYLAPPRPTRKKKGRGRAKK